MRESGKAADAEGTNLSGNALAEVADEVVRRRK